MKFECEKTLLASAIDGVSRAITNRAAIPVLEGIYMKAEGFNLTLTGYDMEMGITTTIECNVLVPGETVLDAKLLSAMVNRMPAGDVCIELNDEGQAKISGGVAEFEIPALNASDYPSLPVTGADNTMTVKCGMLREMIEKTIYAVSQDDKKPAHTGELFVIEPGSLTIVALLTSIVFISYGANCAQNSTSCAYVSVPFSPEMGDVPTVNTAAALSLPSPLRRTFTASSRCMAWICAPIWRSMTENRSSFWKRRPS